MTDYQLIFSSQREYGGVYVEPEAHTICWPKETWLQRRRRELALGDDNDENQLPRIRV